MLHRPLATFGALSLWVGACVAPPESFPDAQAASDTGADGLIPPADAAFPSCEDLPPEGRCEGDSLLFCDPEQGPSARDCSAEGASCLAGDGTPPRCGVVPSSCADLAGGELCAGDRLYLCHGGWLRHVPCDSLGGRCAPEGARPGCAPRAGGAQLVTGKITRTHREAGPEGLGPPLTRAAAGVTVVLLAVADQRPLGLGYADAEGLVSIPFDPGDATEVVLRALTLAVDAQHRLWVTDREDAAHAVQTDPVPLAEGTTAASLHLSLEAGAGAFHVFEVLRDLQGAAASRVTPPLPALQVVWEKGALLACGTCFSRYPPTLFVSGEASDPDEFDPAVLGHELGHYLLWAASRDDSPGGEHDGYPTDPRLAWSEGAATWLGLELLGQQLYVDTTATGATVRDPEDLGATADPEGGLDQLLSEHVVLQVLWDLTDPASGQGDPLFRSPADVYDVLGGYLPSPGLVDRGHAGVDLVDFLDGWICRGHQDAPGLEALTEGLGFPYDFGGPAPPCPKPRAPFDLRMALEQSDDGLRVILKVTSRRSLPLATAHLRAPLPGGTLLELRQELEPIPPHEPTRIAWTLPLGLDPPWVATGLGAAEGFTGEQHASVVTFRRAPPRVPSTTVDLGGLLRLRLVRP